MKRLLVISNHDPKNWENSQKEGWDDIEYLPFPNVSPEKSTEEIISEIVTPICGKIGNFYAKCDEEESEGYVTLQGESTVCYYVFKVLAGEPVNFVFPTTERQSIEEKLPDGSVRKINVFKFVRWR